MNKINKKLVLLFWILIFVPAMFGQPVRESSIIKNITGDPPSSCDSTDRSEIFIYKQDVGLYECISGKYSQVKGVDDGRLVEDQTGWDSVVATALSTPNTKYLVTVNSAVTISADTTAPANIRLKLSQPGIITISSGQTLTIVNGAEFTAPLKQVFSGSGDVKFSNSRPSKIHPEWFGAIADSTDAGVQTANVTAVGKAITAAQNATLITTGGRIHFSAGSTYYFNGTITIPQGSRALTFSGEGFETSRLMHTASGSTPLFLINSSQEITFEDLAIWYSSRTFTGYLIDTAKTSDDSGYLKFKNLQFFGEDNTAESPPGTPTGAYQAAAFIRLDYVLSSRIENCYFGGAALGILGVNGVNVLNVENNTFVNLTDAFIKNPGQNWKVQNTTAEPVRVGANAGKTVFVTQETGYTAYNNSFRDNWIGDASVASVAMTVGGLGLVIDNNRFELPNGSTAIKLLEGSQGVHISSNRSNCLGVDFGTPGSYSRGIVMAANSFNATPQISGTAYLEYSFLSNVGLVNSTDSTSYFNNNSYFNSPAEFNSTFKLGSSGTTLSQIIKGQVSLDPLSIPANSTAIQTFLLTDALVGDTVYLNPIPNLTAGLRMGYCLVPTNGQISIEWHNTTGAAIDQASTSFRYLIIR